MKAYWTIKDGRDVYVIRGCPILGTPTAPWCVYFTSQGSIGFVEGEEVMLVLTPSPVSRAASVKALVGGNSGYISSLARTMHAALAARLED